MNISNDPKKIPSVPKPTEFDRRKCKEMPERSPSRKYREIQV